MNIQRYWIFFFLTTWPVSCVNVCGKGCLVMWCPAVAEADFNNYIDLSKPDPDDPYPCAKLLCPAVTQVKFNSHICLFQPDPDLLPITTTTTTEKPEEPPTTHRLLVYTLLVPARHAETRRNTVFDHTK
ncbi:uncharacterized protein LOC142803379 isoform X3 [Rhipicephalus microplus]|uniref:uncharacterized protein LOC142803379 isoform X3 n=1 Tax=Rhipicephalus microplus TaxID=6941 RepID=UPI003F6BF3C4